MSEILVFIDERPTPVSATATVLQAVATVDADAAQAIQARRAYVTDGVGRPIDCASGLVSGSILRVIRSAPAPAPASPNRTIEPTA